MPKENNKMQVNIENLFKQNVNDLSAIKELYRKLKEVEKKISQIKYIDSTLSKKLKKEYEKLKKIILDENIQFKLNNDIESINLKLNNKVNKSDFETINSRMNSKANKSDIDTINSKLNNKVNKSEVENSTRNLQSQINSLVLESGGDSNLEVVQARTNNDGITFATLKETLFNIEEKKLSELMLFGFSNSENKINDAEIKGKTYNGNFTITNIDRNSLIVGETFKLRIYFKDNTQVASSNAVWKFNYSDGSVSSGTASVTSYRLVEKEVESISVQFVADAGTMYAGKVYLGAKLSNIKTDKSDGYIPFEFLYKSKKLDKIDENIEDLAKKGLNKDTLFIKTNNLFNYEDVEFGKELQPFNIVDNEEMTITDYIPVQNGESLYVYPSIGGSQVANLYDVDKNKIGWITLKTSANSENKISLENVSFIRFNIPKEYYETNKNMFVVSKSKIRNYVPYELIDDKKINTNNTNINWWYGKKGDSLGDSLTGQGFFQKYVSMYYNLDSFKNNGVGGSKLSGKDVDSSRPSMWQDIRINALREDADFITILGGQNDGDVEIGEISKTNMDTNTYVGAYNTIIDKIYKKYNGSIQIILCTPFYVPSEGDNGERFIKLDKAVKEIGQLHGLPVADFGGMSGANKYVKDIYWGDDKTHPIEKFYRDKIAPILIETMDKIKPIDFDKTNSIEYSVTQ